MKSIIKSLVLLSSVLMLVQTITAQTVVDRKGKAWMHWGYNRTTYGTSDIHFQGDGFDFTLYDAVALDMPEEWDASVYLNPRKLTIPQFNFRVGFFITDRNSISFGWDHMKYKLVTNQEVRISGNIDQQASEEYGGVYDYDRIQLKKKLLEFEHSDGFNFVNFTIDHLQEVWISENQRHALSFMAAFSAGAMVPWTDTRVFNTHHRNRPHVAGYALSGQFGARFEFFTNGFLQFRLQHGFANLPDVMIQDHLPSRASHSVWFTERSISLGFYIPVKRKK
jgi:hypothetical protein